MADAAHMNFQSHIIHSRSTNSFNRFIDSEKARAKKYNLPPSQYVEFNDPKEDERTNWQQETKKWGASMLDKATFLNRIPGFGQLRKGNVEDFKMTMMDASGKAKSSLEERAGAMGAPSREDVTQSLNKSQTYFKQTVATGDLKTIKTDAKNLFDSVKNNEQLKSTVNEHATLAQQSLRSFLDGYQEGKKYEEEHHTDPRTLLTSAMDSAKKMSVLVAREAPGLASTGGDLGELRKRAESFAEQAKNLDKITKEDEDAVKRDAEAWMESSKQIAMEKKKQVEADWNASPEVAAMREKAKEMKIKADQARVEAERLIGEGKVVAERVQRDVVDRVKKNM